MNDTQKTEEILNALMNYYNGWGTGRTSVMFPELRLGSGYNDIAQRRIDLFVISSEKGNYTTAFEIKVSRQDFLKDIKDPLKQRGARLYSSNFFYVAPQGMIKIDEVPVWAGLKEYDFETKKFKTSIPAPLLSRNTPSWSLICSLVRRVNNVLYRDKIEEQKNLINAYKKELKSCYRAIQQIKENNFDKNTMDIIVNPILNSPTIKVLKDYEAE